MTKKISLMKNLFLLLCCSVTVQAQDFVGDWEGVVKVSGIELPIVMHIQSTDDGGYTGTLDSPAQGGFDIPITELDIKGKTLFFQVGSIGASYEGQYNDQNGRIEGKFVQNGLMDLNFSRQKKVAVDYSVSNDENNIIGTWAGGIELPGRQLKFVIHIEQGENGLVAKSDSPEQGSFGLKVDEVSLSGGELIFKIKSTGVKYSGRLLADHQSVHGFFEQGGGKFILNLKKTDAEDVAVKRPQHPSPPFAYSVEEVVVNNASADIQLAGTLTIPENKKTKAAAILITGSGPQDRDETVFGHKPFWVIADHLTENGYAVLRMDDRGVGQSGGDFATATTADFATDISAAVDFLKTRDDVPADKIGLIGHSEGGMIAPMVEAERSDLAFTILLAAPGVPIPELLAEQKYLIELSQGGDETTLKQQRKKTVRLNQKLADLVGSDNFNTQATEYVATYFKETGLNEEQTKLQTTAMLKSFNSPWFGYFLTFKPAKYLTQLKAPVLALNGSLDLQVEADSNLAGIREALDSIQHADYTIKKLDKLNHLFQSTETGKISEYGTLEETFAPEVLNTMTDWLNQRF